MIRRCMTRRMPKGSRHCQSGSLQTATSFQTATISSPLNIQRSALNFPPFSFSAFQLFSLGLSIVKTNPFTGRPHLAFAVTLN
jgi:hypothetical protein